MGSDAGCDDVYASIEYRHPKPSDQPPLKVPDVWGTLG